MPVAGEAYQGLSIHTPSAPHPCLALGSHLLAHLCQVFSCILPLPGSPP